MDQMASAHSISLWDASAQEEDYEAPFSGDGTTVDVAIVGGGFTGLSTAMYAAEAGLNAHVLEAKQIGYGGSGRNVGLVNAGLWLPPAKVREALGEARGPQFVKLFSDGPRIVFDLIEKHQIRCELTKTGTIHAAHTPSGFKGLKSRHAEWQRLGEPVDLLDREAVSELIGSNAFHGGLVDQRAGTINPMGYCRGLARAARAQGATISTGIRVTNLAREGALWRVTTDKGSLLAKHVVLGTNAYTDTLWPGLQRVCTMINYFQLATIPLGPDAAHILPGRQGLWDTGTIMFSLRRDAFDRLIIGSMGSVIGDKDQGLSHRWARKQISRIFPELGDIAFEDAWHGQIAKTPDHLPRIYELDERLYTAIGYNGRGITTGTIFGQALAGLASGMDRDDLPLPVARMKTIPAAPIMSRLYETAFTANQFIKSF
jgi:glycine/D-amino acid oxidase-like deaminating enzyme